MIVRNQVAAFRARKFLQLPALALLAAIAMPAVAATPEQTAREVLAKSPIIDGHNDTPHQIAALFNRDFSKFDLAALPADVLAKTHTDIKTARAGYLGGQYWSVYVDAALPKHEAVTRTIQQIDVVRQMMARYPETFSYAATAAEVEAAMKKGKIASLIGMEGGHSIGSSLDILRQTYALGARYMTLTHSLTTDWADSSTDAPKHDGLSPFGFEVLTEMNQLGMIADISHVSEATMHDVLDKSTAPVLFTHSNARAITPHPRNVPDSVLKRLPQNGGVVMVTFVPGFTSAERRQWEFERSAIAGRAKTEFSGNPVGEKAAVDAWIAANPQPKATLAQVADHIDHIRKVAGVDHIGIGGDFGGVDELPVGLENVSTYPALFAELVRRGYAKADLAKIAQGNVLRVMRGVEKAARK
ncbi:dipeptidase [Sphingorhabdus sp. EL138]|uniref:dipeptidase n=1 Tax=Sphingorhabdus sp. EL138 TaxID=2073156 RepID=UPI0025DE1814|nr:dipeptidase [Sphingorhabdus sp. EL138]